MAVQVKVGLGKILSMTDPKAFTVYDPYDRTTNPPFDLLRHDENDDPTIPAPVVNPFEVTGRRFR